MFGCSVWPSLKLVWYLHLWSISIVIYLHTDSTTVNNDLDPNEVTVVEYVLKFEMNFTLTKNRSLEKTVRVYKPVMIEVLKQMTLLKVLQLSTAYKHENFLTFPKTSWGISLMWSISNHFYLKHARIGRGKHKFFL